VKRWALWLALLLSVGVNVGILLTLAAGPGGWPWSQRPERPRAERSWDGPPRGVVPHGEMAGRHRDGPARHLGRVADRLGLEGGERERFVAIQEDFLATVRDGRRRRGELHRELRAELTSPEPDRRRVEELLGELSVVQLEMEQAFADAVLASRELLGPEQEEAYLVFLRRLPGRHGGRR
jgi:Spy/CpxP family protein refolding chaperone